MAWFLSVCFLLSPPALAGTQGAVRYSLTSKPICGDSPQQPLIQRGVKLHLLHFRTSVGCFRDSCKTAGQVIFTFLHLLQRVPCIPADIQDFSLAVKSVFLPDLAKNGRKPTLLGMFLWRLIPVISWVSNEGWRNVLPHRRHFLTVCTLWALLYYSYNALLITFLTVYDAL